MRYRWLAPTLSALSLVGAVVLVLVASSGANATVRQRAQACDLSLVAPIWVHVAGWASAALAVLGIGLAIWLVATRRTVAAVVLALSLLLPASVWGLGAYSLLRDVPSKTGTNCSG